MKGCGCVRAAMKLINKNSKEFEEAIVRRLVSPANLDVSGGRVYRGYGGNADMTVMNELARMGGVAGTSLASLGAFPPLIRCDSPYRWCRG